KAGDRLNKQGKYLLTHTDGENKGLLPVFGTCRFDDADGRVRDDISVVTHVQRYTAVHYQP
ncbi:MAG: hypothetical protein P8141_02065, partial [Gammaproteobacteria bacterium]